MGALIVVGMLATLLAVEPESSAGASAEHTGPGHDAAGQRLIKVAVASLKDFLSRDAAIATAEPDDRVRVDVASLDHRLKDWKQWRCLTSWNRVWIAI